MNEEKVLGIIQEAWVAIMEEYKDYRNNYPELIFHNDKKMKFNQTFHDGYKKIMDEFMIEETTILDSHKQAALLIICFLEANVIEHPLDEKDEISLVPQMIALNIGLSYMLLCLNDRLEKHGIKKKIVRYYMPVATACDTPYPEILCRILYQEQHFLNMNFNVLELSDRLFLLEYVNLLQYGIEPYLLKETV